jgi:hypothetical protein
MGRSKIPYKTCVSLTLLCCLAALPAKGSALPQTPPLSPINETAIQNDKELAQTCKVKLHKLIPIVVTGSSLTTRNVSFGPVWRSDFTLGDGSLSYGVNRAVCWKDQTSMIRLLIAVGQDVDPLVE